MLRVALASAAVLTTVLIAPPPALADDVAVPGAASASVGTTATLEVAVPEGVTPTRITGRLRLDGTVDGTVVFLVGGRVAEEVPALAESAVTVPVGAADVVDGRIAVQVRVDAAGRDSDRACLAGDDVRATLDEVRLDFDGSESAPTSLADFFPAYAPQVDVVVAADAADDVIEAGLEAVAAVSSRYAIDTAVRLTTPDALGDGTAPGRRVVRVEGGSGTATTRVQDGPVPTLVLSGGPDELTAAARALGSPALGLADGVDTEGLSAETGEITPAEELSLAELGVERAVLSGYGRVEQYVGIRQDAFGGPVGSLTVDLVGTHTAVPDGARAQLDVYFNDRLVDSVQLDDDPALEREISVPAAEVQGDNGLVLVLSAIPEGESCTAARQLPMEVHLDTERSVVHADRGDAATRGFAAFPQSLGGRLPVAVSDHAEDRVAAAVDAAHVVAALQRRSARVLDVSLVDPGALLDGDTSGLLVGAGEDDTTALSAPLRLSGMRLLDYAEATFQVGTDRPYAALEAVRHDGRDVLVLGSWAPDGDGAALQRAAAEFIGAEGWDALSADLLIQTEDADAFTLDSNAIVPQEERVEEARSFGWWFAGGLGVLLLLLALRWLVGRRRKRRIAQIVDAQVAADADAVRADGAGDRDRG